MAIKIRGLITTFARYVAFDIEDMPFKRVKGRETVDIIMIQTIGIVESTLQGFKLTPFPGE